MSSFIDLLVTQSKADRVVISAELDQALTELDQAFEEIAPELAVEYVGPGIGVEGNEDVYKMVIRPHEWQMNKPSWSLKVCDALPNADWRAAWTVQGSSRLRKQMLVKKLPEFFAGLTQAIEAAGKADTAAAARVQEMASKFN